MERSQSGLGYVLDTIRHRLGVGVRQILDVPALTLPLALLFLAVPAAIVWSRRRGGAIAGGLGSIDGWLDLTVVLILAGAVAWAVNDTGPGAAAMFFLYTMSALAYPALLLDRGSTDR